MYEVVFQDYQIPPSQGYETDGTLPNYPPPDPPTLTEFVEDVETILAGTGETIDDSELALLTPDEWESFLAGLFGFVDATQPHGSDQNSYYDDHSDEAPLGPGFVQFMEEFGWLDSIERMVGYHYYDYLQGHDPELMAVAEAAHRFVHAATSGGDSLASLAGMPFSLTANGYFLTFTWHNGSAPVPTFSPDPNNPHSVVVTAAGLGYWTAQATPDPSAGSGATDVPYAWDFTGMSTDALLTMHYVSEALQYLDDSPAAVELLRAAVAAGVKVRIVTGAVESRYDPMSHTVFWNPGMGVRLSNGGIMSPAMVLIHELAHGVNGIDHPADDPQFGNVEERRVILTYEQVIASQLGEPTRNDHSGVDVYSIQNVTYHAPPTAN